MMVPRSVLPKALRPTGKRPLRLPWAKVARSVGRVSKNVQARRNRWTAERLARLAKQETKRR
jgi:hypothetical protein